jgi:hypothetical protein
MHFIDRFRIDSGLTGDLDYSTPTGCKVQYYHLDGGSPSFEISAK